MNGDGDKYRKDFLLEEYRALRQEILSSIQDVPSNEKLSIIFSGAFWAWLLTNANNIPKEAILMAAWLPLIIVLIFFMRAKSFDRKFDSLHNYILQIEKHFDVGKLGWEKFIADEKKGWFRFLHIFLWSSLFALNFAFGAAIFVMNF